MFTIVLMHCRPCNSPRPGLVCWKCGATTKRPDAGWDYPDLPDVNLIRKLAKEVGYAIAEHGSKERDLDLMAMPWTEDAVSIADLVLHLCTHLVYNDQPARMVEREVKPHGREAFTIQLNGWFEAIDLSVMPRHQ